MDNFIPPDRWEFIWASYAIFLITVIALVVWPIIRKKQLKNELRQYYQRKKLLSTEPVKPAGKEEINHETAAKKAFACCTWNGARR